MSDPELLVDAHAVIGEGPVWVPEENLLYWVDIMRHLVHCYDPASGEDRSFDVGQPVSAMAPRANGGLVLALHDGFGLFDITSQQLDIIALVEADQPGNRMNDGKCDSAGRFWAGTMLMAEHKPVGALYRLDPDHRVTQMLDGVTTSNGLGWSLDDRTMYYIDTPTQGIDAFDFDPVAGTITNRRRLITIPKELGGPDGMTVDAEGYLWVAIWRGWRVQRFAPDGTFDREIMLPASRVSCPTFGGPDLSDLYVTTASIGLTQEQLQAESHAGGLFRCRPGVKGLPPHRFRG